MCGGRVRKLLVVALVVGLVAAAVRALRGTPAPQFSNHPSVNGGPGATPDRPLTEAPAPEPEPEPEPAPTPAEQVAAVGPEAGEPTWVAPVDGACPEGYPIKAKLKSQIFHQPGGLAYDRTKPDRCYPTAEAAEADGLRAAKR